MKCRDCAAPATHGLRCWAHTLVNRRRATAFSQERYQRRIQAGECVDCGKENRRAPKRYCPDCALKRKLTYAAA